MLNRDEAIRLLRYTAGLAGATVTESEVAGTLVICIPGSPAPASEAKQDKAEPAASPGRFRVLHVEDVDRASDLIYYYLRNRYDVDTAQTAESAFERAMSQQYDFILMDLNLGKGMNGFELTELLRKTERYAKTPIVAISGYTTRKDVDRSITAGCNAFLSKPFLKDDLLRLLHQLESKFELIPGMNLAAAQDGTASDGTAKAIEPVSAPLFRDGLTPPSKSSQ